VVADRVLVPALGVALAALALLAAGCGGSKSPSVASITTGTSPGAGRQAPSAQQSRAAFATCLGQHGFTASVGSAAAAQGRALDIEGVIVTGSVDPSSPQFRAAMGACRKLLPGGGPPSASPAERARWAAAMTRFAACMRTHGVPAFPDPSGNGTFPIGALQGLGPMSPLVQRAFNACKSLEPKSGPHLEL
jgi:hypothetical protein